jgi:hypothetical protein
MDISEFTFDVVDQRQRKNDQRKQCDNIVAAVDHASFPEKWKLDLVQRRKCKEEIQEQAERKCDQ